MKSRFWIFTIACLIVISFGSIAILGLDSQSDHGKQEPKAAGIHWAKGQAPGASAGRGGKSPNLVDHLGGVMQSTVTQAIFWGPKWATSSFVGDKITGLDSFYHDFGGSNFAGTSSEYGSGSGSTHQGYVIDTSTATGGNTTGPIATEVCKMISNPVANGYYPVYVDVRRGNAGYCAWHSYATCQGVVVQIAFFFDLDGDVGCDPKDTSGLHSQGLAALANVSGHEISEAKSDPHLNAWYDSSGDENADKCAWTFGHPLVTFGNGSQWKIQGNWSNGAYNNQSGYPNSSGLKGCIDGN